MLPCYCQVEVEVQVAIWASGHPGGGAAACAAELGWELLWPVPSALCPLSPPCLPCHAVGARTAQNWLTGMRAPPCPWSLWQHPTGVGGTSLEPQKGGGPGSHPSLLAWAGWDLGWVFPVVFAWNRAVLCKFSVLLGWPFLVLWVERPGFCCGFLESASVGLACSAPCLGDRREKEKTHGKTSVIPQAPRSLARFSPSLHVSKFLLCVMPRILGCTEQEEWGKVLLSAPSLWKQKSMWCLGWPLHIECALDSALFLRFCPSTEDGDLWLTAKEPSFLVGSFSFLTDCCYSLTLTFATTSSLSLSFYSKIHIRPMLDPFFQLCIFLKLSYSLSLQFSILPHGNFLQSLFQSTNFLLSFVYSTL